MLVYQRVIGRYWTSAHLRSICHWIAHPNHPNPCETWARDMCDIFCYNRRCTAATLPHAQPIHRLRTKKPKWMGNVTGKWWGSFLLENHGIFRIHHVQTRRLDIFCICLLVTICLGNFQKGSLLSCWLRCSIHGMPLHVQRCPGIFYLQVPSGKLT